MRTATVQDVPVLESLIAESARSLCRVDYTARQIEAAIGTAWAVDTELIRDGSYFAVEVDDRIVACGGWSRRATLFGGDAQPAAAPTSWIPRATPPASARAARALRVRSTGPPLPASGAVMTTLTGMRLYAACGYRASDPIDHTLAPGVSIAFVPMHKLFR